MMPTIQNASVVIVGAGFSAAASEGKTPLMGTFFDRLEASTHSTLHEFVVWTAGRSTEASIEKILLIYEQIRTSPKGALPWADAWRDRLAQLEREFSEYTLARLENCVTLSADNWAVNLFAQVPPTTTVISFNYDNIAERILSNRKGLIHRFRGQRNVYNCPHCKMRSLLDVACSCSERREIEESDWRGAVLKLHGSIAWKRCVNIECCSFNCLVADEHCRPFKPCACENCGSACVSALVLPSLGKHLDKTPEIKTMWQAAWHAIEQADTIWVFGFSMPLSDELFAQHIRHAIKAGRKLKQITVVDVQPDQVIERFKNCLPQEMSVEFVPLAVKPAEIPYWYDEMVARTSGS